MSQSRDGDADGLEDKVSRFGTELEGLSESDLRDRAGDSLGFGESWFGDAWDYDDLWADRREVDRGDD